MYKPIKYNPTIIKPLRPRKKKDLRYWQTNLKPLGDVDKDKKVNVLDCYPYDKNRQGFWHDIKKKVVGGPSEVQQTQQDIEDFKYDEETGEYELRPKKKKYGEKGYIKEGAQELGQDIKKYAGKAGTYIAEKGAQKVETARKTGKKMQEIGEVLTEEAGIRQASKNIKEGLKLKRPRSVQPRRQPRQTIKSYSSRPPPSRGWWGSPSYEKPKLDRMPSQGQQTQMSEYEEIPEELMELLEEKPVLRYDDKRSPRYQEQSPLGPGVVPYRPVSTQQATLKVKPVGKQFGFKGTMGSRPHGLMPMAQFPRVTFRPMYFGRRVRR